MIHSANKIHYTAVWGIIEIIMKNENLRISLLSQETYKPVEDKEHG